MDFRRINVVVSPKAFKVLEDFQKEHGCRTRDQAMEEFLLSRIISSEPTR